MRGDLKAVHVDDIPSQLLSLPTWREFNSETIMSGGFISAEVLKNYFFTTDISKLNRKWIWGVFGGTTPELAMNYYQDTYDQKMKARLPVRKVQTLDIDEEWVDKLLAFEVPVSK